MQHYELTLSHIGPISGLVRRASQPFVQWVDRRSRFSFRDSWTVPGTVDDVAAMLSQPELLPKWWPQFRDVKVIALGEADGLNRIFESQIKGFLPYGLSVQFCVDTVEYPQAFGVAVTGDFQGRGWGTLSQLGDAVSIDYGLDIRVERRMIPYVLFVRPALLAQHAWTMWSGGRSLATSCARRRMVVGNLPG